MHLRKEIDLKLFNIKLNQVILNIKSIIYQFQ